MSMIDWMEDGEELGWIERFFLGWGLNPTDGSADIPYPIYIRMVADAYAQHGERFAAFVDRVVDATDGRWYLTAESWNEVRVRYPGKDG